MLTLTVEGGAVTRADRAARKLVGKPVAHILSLADRQGWKLDVASDDEDRKSVV